MNLDDIKLGPCSFTLNGTDLGYTSGGVAASIDTTIKESRIDHFGKVSERIIVQERIVTITTKLMETSIANMLALLGHSNAVERNGMLVMGSAAGFVLQSNSLLLRPMKTTGDEDMFMKNVTIADSIKINWQIDAERLFDIQVIAREDANGNLFYYGPGASAS